MKLYTKTGDKGTTSLYDGNRIHKSSIFFEVLGTLDELSSNIGLLCAYITTSSKTYEKLELGDTRISNDMIKYLREIQVILLDIGSNIAVVNENKKKRVPKIVDKDIEKIESKIDECEAKNKKLTEFLLPGKTVSDSQCHVCRSITRRVERSMWELDNASYSITEGKDNSNIIDLSNVHVDENILKYVNRMSDFFFALSRNLSLNEDIKVSDARKIN